MSKAQPVLLNRAKMCAALRSGQHRQQKYDIGFYDHPEMPVCFAGLGYRIFNIRGPRALEKTLGISHSAACTLVKCNDSNYTFPMLADMLEALPVTEYAE